MGLFRFFKRKNTEATEPETDPQPEAIEEKIEPEPEPEPEPEKIVNPKVPCQSDTLKKTVVTDIQESEDSTVIAVSSPQRSSLLSRLKTGLSKTRSSFGLGKLLSGHKNIDEDLLESLETILLTADVGIETTDSIIEQLQQQIHRKHLKDSDALLIALKKVLEDILIPCQQSLEIHKPEQGPYVLLMVGVNGVGKTTTIGKLAKYMQDAGLKVMLAAGDTFRAAAVEQLTVWGERNQIPVIAQPTGSDSASVIFDALQSAKAKGIDVLIADTAGRLHTKQNLMEELKKVVRVIQKLDPEAPHEIMLTLDASMGQNALRQAQEFHQAVKVSGLALTKLDGTAKGGTLFAIANTLKLPIRFIGLGEGIEDLREFDAKYFVEALTEND